MTKREFDRATRINYGATMGRLDADAYRVTERLVDLDSDDFIARRATHVAWLRRLQGDTMPALDRGSPFRAPADFRARKGAPLLGGRFRRR
jgi:hypothetical protein